MAVVASFFLVLCWSENGVPVICWFEAKGTKGAIKLSRDGGSLILFDAKYPFIRRKRKFGAWAVHCFFVVVVVVCVVDGRPCVPPCCHGVV